jgi:integrase
VHEDRTRALTREQVRSLLDDTRVPLRERALWSLLYETAARVHEVLALNADDIDAPNHRARVIRKGGAADVIIWQRQGATLLGRYLKGRKRGPLFVTDRAARRDLGLSAADLDERGRARLSYDTAEAIFKRWSGGATLHQLRHSSLSHDADAGTGAPMLQAKSGHKDIRSLARYAKVSTEGLAQHQRDTDPGRR